MNHEILAALVVAFATVLGEIVRRRYREPCRRRQAAQQNWREPMRRS